MKEKSVYVIKDQAGNYVSDRRTFMYVDGEMLYLSYTGLTTGFSGFSVKERAEKERAELEELCNRHGFNKKFSVEHMDMWKVPKGELVIENIPMEGAA